MKKRKFTSWSAELLARCALTKSGRIRPSGKWSGVAAALIFKGYMHTSPANVSPNHRGLVARRLGRRRHVPIELRPGATVTLTDKGRAALLALDPRDYAPADMRLRLAQGRILKRRKGGG